MYLLRMCDLESAIFRNSFLLADSLRALRNELSEYSSLINELI